MSFQQILDKINPKKLFLIDGLGALLSALILGLFLVRFEKTFGMPSEELYYLSCIACLFSLYSLLCFMGIKTNFKTYLIVIAIANVLYCCLTIMLVYYLFQELTIVGITYFILEVIIITTLACIELKIALHLNNNKLCC